ncbi:HSP18 transcriptional regulator [Actinophytocola sp.]|uniref:HSP18 transcriptional regulator n=1 Tax=Actinophytocola sp. TaxID=1872138 RepID=UPI0039C87E6C
MTTSAITEAVTLVQAVRSGADAEAITAEHLLAALTVLRHLREQLASWEPELITAARERGVSWASLAPALGVTSRQAAERRYLRLRPAAGELTGEGRVRAERDKRAGDRAVARWARENSGVLRQLAGQVSALEDLAAPAQHRVDVVQRALADDDPATLLTPLADAHSHLEATHAKLARRIKSVTEHTEQLRRDTLDQRSNPRARP